MEQSLHFSEDGWSLKDNPLNTGAKPEATLKEKSKMLLQNQRLPNILPLNEKVAAIRRYEIEPSFTGVARYFNCSPRQIKRIITQKDKILNEWDNRSSKPEANLTREMKISFLGKGVYEWVRRMMYYSYFDLTDALIQTMAFKFKEVLNLPNHVHDESWVASFRDTYNLKEVSTRTLGIGCQEGLSVQISDILRYLRSTCGSREGAPETAVSTRVSEVNHTEAAALYPKSPPGNATNDVGYSCAPISCTAALCGRGNPSIKQTHPPRSKSEPAKEETEMETETNDNTITHEEAMLYVKQLEEFALLKENFRLIGLVERLEEALKRES